MTAYARAEKNQDDLTVNLEIRSYNSRYLDIALRLPGAYFELEDRVKKFVSEYLKRGRIEIRISVADASEAAAAYAVVGDEAPRE